MADDSIDIETDHSAGAVPLALDRGGAAPAALAADQAALPTRYLVIDTNVLLGQYALVRALYGRMLAGDAWILIPTTVVTELDGLKQSVNPVRPGQELTIGDVARSATDWLLEVARGARRGCTSRLRLETWGERDQAPLPPGLLSSDDKILACCLHFSRACPVTLWTDDRNLALRAEANGIPTLGRARLPLLCEAVGVALSVGEMEAMEVDGDLGMEEDWDVPLFQRRPVRVHAPGNGYSKQSHDFNAPGSGNGIHGPARAHAHASGTASVPSFAASSPAQPLPPTGALAAALAELNPTHPQIQPRRYPSTPRASSLPPPSRPLPTNAPRPLPPAGALASALAELGASSTTSATTPTFSSPSTSTIAATAATGTNPGASQNQYRPQYQQYQYHQDASRRLSASGYAFSPWSTILAAPPRPRTLPPELAAALGEILGTALAAIDNGAYVVLTPAQRSDPFALAARLVNLLDRLVANPPAGHGHGHAQGPGQGQDYARPLARCAGCARTIAGWLGVGAGVNGGNARGRKIRSGEAADALRGIAGELAKLGAALETATWEVVAQAVHEEE